MNFENWKKPARVGNIKLNFDRARVCKQMLIFLVDINPCVAASMTPDNFVDKLIAEARQMFSGALSHFYPRAGKAVGYANHPFTLWLMQSEWAWNWLVAYCGTLSRSEEA